MNYYATKEGVILDNPSNFNLTQIFECGQCFRWERGYDEISKLDYWEGIARGRYLRIDILLNNKYLFRTSLGEFKNVWYDYFDLGTDYSEIIKLIDPEDSFLVAASRNGSGIRILNQDPWEALISFIISQQNNIPRIKRIIETLSRTMGDSFVTPDGRTLHKFPTDLQILDKYYIISSMGLGYRDEYVLSAAIKMVSEPDFLNDLIDANAEYAISKLKEFHGVGEKVANCTLLFGLRHKEVFPVDVWIRRILEKYYSNGLDVSKYNPYSGVIQQYMFYYERMLKSNE